MGFSVPIIVSDFDSKTVLPRPRSKPAFKIIHLVIQQMHLARQALNFLLGPSVDIEVELPAYCAQWRVAVAQGADPAETRRDYAWRIAAQSGAMKTGCR